MLWCYTASSSMHAQQHLRAIWSLIRCRQHIFSMIGCLYLTWAKARGVKPAAVCLHADRRSRAWLRRNVNEVRCSQARLAGLRSYQLKMVSRRRLVYIKWYLYFSKVMIYQCKLRTIKTYLNKINIMITLIYNILSHAPYSRADN